MSQVYAYNSLLSHHFEILNKFTYLGNLVAPNEGVDQKKVSPKGKSKALLVAPSLSHKGEVHTAKVCTVLPSDRVTWPLRVEARPIFRIPLQCWSFVGTSGG